MPNFNRFKIVIQIDSGLDYCDTFESGQKYLMLSWKVDEKVMKSPLRKAKVSLIGETVGDYNGFMSASQ